MALFQQGTAPDKPIGSEVQVETLPEIYPPRGVSESQAAYDARVTAWGARTRTITFITPAGLRQTTAALAFSSTAAAIQTAMEGLAGIGAGNIKVAGAGRTFEFAFSGTLSNTAFKRMFHKITDSGIVSYFETVVAGVSQAFQQAVKEDITRNAIENLVGAGTLASSGAPAPKDIGDPARYAGTGRQYVETVTATGGTRTLTVSGQTTAAIAFGAIASAIQTALEALTNVNPGDVTVSGTAGSYTYDWMGNFSGPNNVTMSVTPTALTGGTSTLVLTKEGTVKVPLYR